MTKFTGIVCSLAIVMPVFAEPQNSIDWTRTVSQIRALESSPPQDASDKRITYDSLLKGEKYHLEYLFSDQGRLVNVLYYRSFSADGDACLNEYDRMRALYTDELGSPREHNAPDKNTLEQYGTEQVCTAVAEGKVRANSEWTQDVYSNLSVQLSVWKGQPYVGVSFTPIKLSAND